MRRSLPAEPRAALAGLAAFLAVQSISCGKRPPTAITMNNITVEDNISGKAFLAIESALAVVAPRRIDPASYSFVVAGESVLLLSHGTNQLPGAPVNLGVKSAARVEMSDSELKDLVSALDQVTPQERLQGRSFLAVRTAAELFQSRLSVDLIQYRIEVVREGDSLVVIFAGKDVPPGTHGRVAATPGFEVELAAKDLSVLRANFVR